ncbi:MAG TPA: pitrilysin family protein [Acidobacteriota bacterium]|nr:pitrilysin family protein [Acidobacteriota bacterium]
MRRLLILPTLLICSTLFAAPSTAPPPGPERPLRLPQISERKLPNGLTVVVAPLPTVPKVSAILSFQTGASAWRDQHQGAPNVTANVLREGTDTRTSKQIQEELRSMGATLTSNVTDDDTQLSGATLAEFTERYLNLMNDIVLHANFPESEVQLAKDNFVQNIQAQRADPNFLANERTRKEVFGNHAYSFVVPDEQGVQKLTRENLKEFASTYYVPNNAYLILVGDIQAEPAFALAQKIFGSWKSKDLPVQKNEDLVRRDKRQIYFVNRPGSVQSTIYIGTATFPRKSPDYFAMRTADTIFGGAFNSRLTQNIREKKGYTYSPFSSNSTWAQSGLFTVGANVRNEVTGPTILETFYELDRMRVAPVTKEELDEAKAYQNGNFSIELASQAGLAGRIATIYTYGLPHDFIQTFRTKVNAVTAEDVEHASAKYFDTYHCAIVIVGDYGKVKDQVDPFGDVKLYQATGETATAKQ